MFPEFAARADYARPAHPGTVTFVGTDGQERVEAAESIPEWLKFAPGPDGSPLAVVRVVRLLSDRGYSLRSYGAAGQLLWVGLTVPSGPPAAVAEPVTTPRATPTFPTPRATSSPYAAASTGWF